MESWRIVWWQYQQNSGGDYDSILIFQDHISLVNLNRYFKWYRLAAIHMIITNLYHSNVRDRKSDCTIGLGAMAIWMLNGLYRRPDDRYTKLAEEACQHVPVDYDEYDPEEDQDNPDLFIPLMYDAGLYFVCDIVTDASSTFRLPYHKAISEAAIMAAFKMSLDEVRNIIGIADHQLSRTVRNAERTNNRSSRKTLRMDDIRPMDRPLPQINEDFIQNVVVQPQQRIQGPDVQHFTQHGGGTRDAQVLIRLQVQDDPNFTRRIQVLLEQFFHDLLLESPNKKSGSEGAWTNIPKALRPIEATEHLYQSFALPFHAAQFTFCTPEQWDLHFNRMFPAQYPKSVGQNFSKCTYYAQWISLLATLSPQHISRVRATIRQKVDSLIWIPYTGSDRIWSTRPMKNTRGWFVLPPESTPQGPLIAINLNACMHGPGSPFLRPSANAQDYRQEEEEEEEEEEDQQIRRNPPLSTTRSISHIPSRAASSRYSGHTLKSSGIYSHSNVGTTGVQQRITGYFPSVTSSPSSHGEGSYEPSVFLGQNRQHSEDGRQEFRVVNREHINILWEEMVTQTQEELANVKMALREEEEEEE